VAKLYREVVERVRKKEMKRLKKILSEEEYKKLKGLMWALRASKDNISDKYKAVLKIAFKYSPELKKVLEEVSLVHLSLLTHELALIYL